MPSWLETTEPDLTIDPSRGNCLLATGDWTFQHANVLIPLLGQKHGGIEAGGVEVRHPVLQYLGDFAPENMLNEIQRRHTHAGDVKGRER